MSSYPDINATTDDWVDVYASTGITVGSKLIIQNKSNTAVVLFESVTKPDSDSIDGYMLTPIGECYEDTIVEAGSIGLWVKAYDTNSKISVQEG